MKCILAVSILLMFGVTYTCAHADHAAQSSPKPGPEPTPYQDPWNPCMGKSCGENAWCENMTVQCVKEPCYPDPVCKQDIEGCMPFQPYESETCKRMIIKTECNSYGECWMTDYDALIPGICCRAECGGSMCIADAKPEPCDTECSSSAIMVSIGTMMLALLSALIA